MTVQIEVDEKLVEKVDEMSFGLETNRTVFVEKALLEAIQKAQKTLETKEKERRAVEAYRKYPVQSDEFYVDEEQLIEAWKDL